MKVNTEHFGDISCREEDIITFKEGLPGFTKFNRFVIVEPEDSAPFCWLQSVDKKEVSFVIVDPAKFRANYKAVVPVAEMEMLGINNSDSAKVYALVTLSSDPSEVSMNLKAPLIVNNKDKIGAQVILRNTDYDIEYKMFAPSKKVEMRYSSYERSISSNYHEKGADLQAI